MDEGVIGFLIIRYLFRSYMEDNGQNEILTFREAKI